MFTKVDLEQKIKELFGITNIPNMISIQINKYARENGYSYKDMARALVYFYVILSKPVTKDKTGNPTYGIGIIPSVIEDSRKYFIEQERQIKAQQEASKRYDANSNIIICNKPITITPKNKRLIDIASIEEEDN